MQQLKIAMNGAPTSTVCARQLMEAIPLVMRHFRGWMRSHRIAGLSVPQFRALALLGRLDGADLRSVAEHLGLSTPSASRMIQTLVTKGFVVREAATGDRRQIALHLSERGRAVMKAAQRHTEGRIAQVLGELSSDERAELSRAA